MPEPIIPQEEANAVQGITQAGSPFDLATNFGVDNIANANQGVSSSDAPVGGSVIPPGNTVGENIDQTVNPGGVSAQDLATIQQAKSLYTLAQQIPVTPTPSNAALMPTLNQPINVGTSSGQITGSHGVYVDPGFVAPWGALMQKQAAQDEQTNLALKNQQLAKQARDTAFKFEKPKFKVKDPGFQKNLNETATSTINSYVDQAKELYGQDWQAALKTDTRLGREFQSDMDGLNVVARNADLMTDKFAEIKANIKTGDVYYSDAVREAYREYEEMSKRFEGGDVRALGEARRILEDIDGHTELNTFLNDKGILSNIKGKVFGRTGVSNFGDFMQLKTTNRTLYDENIKNIVQSVRKSMGSEYPYTDEDIETTLLGHLQNESKTTKSLKSKPKVGGGSGRMAKEDVRINEGSKELNIDNTRAGGGVKKYNGTGAIPLKQTKTGFNIDGLQELNLDGSTTPISNVQQVKPVELVYVDVTDDQGNVTKEKAVSIEYEEEVPIRQSISASALLEPVKYETVSVSKVVRYDDIKDQMKTIYGDPPNDAFEGLSKTSEADELGI
jgi:hypothetical protein